MIIETKFNVGEKVRHIHQTNTEGKGKIEFIILQMKTETCFGGSQTWYTCRPLVDVYDKYDKEKPVMKEPILDLVQMAEIELESVPTEDVML